MLKLYVVVRNDIGIPYQMCQVAHAVANFATEHIPEFVEWNHGNNTICVLQARNGGHLAKLVETAKDGDFKFTEFYEPDADSIGAIEWDGYFDDHFGKGPWLTAVAFAPNWFVQNVMLADLPLALDADTIRRKHGLPTDFQPLRSERYRELVSRSVILDRLEVSTPRERRAYFKSLKTKTST